MRTLLGLILAVTPAALWIAWTPGLLAAVALIALASAMLLVWLTESSPRPEGVGDDRVELPPEFVDEVQRLFPLTYHHSSAGPARFRRSMRRLSQELQKSR